MKSSISGQFSEVSANECASVEGGATFNLGFMKIHTGMGFGITVGGVGVAVTKNGVSVKLGSDVHSVPFPK